MKRGIFLVANLKSQALCANLIFSIRSSGCSLPIRIIHFGGNRITDESILREVELLHIDDFPKEAIDFLNKLRTVLTECPMGYLYRFLALYSDWDEFIYSDNDIVALTNWETLFNYLPGYDLVHADEEYTTKGKYNYDKPQLVKSLLGQSALDSAITAGHFVMRRDVKIVEDMLKAVEWYSNHPGIAKKHDQAMLHIASLIGNWHILNLCKPPFNWLSSWAGDYKNLLNLMQIMQSNDPSRRISHLHYSGGMPSGSQPIEELLFSHLENDKRLGKLISAGIRKLSGVTYISNKRRRAVNRLKQFFV